MILLVTRIRLLWRRVDADSDDLLGRVTDAQIRMEKPSLGL